MAKSNPTITLREYANFLKRFLRQRMHLVTILGIALLINIGLQLFNPQILRVFIDNALAGAEISILTRMALLFIAIAMVHQLVTWPAILWAWICLSTQLIPLVR